MSKQVWVVVVVEGPPPSPRPVGWWEGGLWVDEWDSVGWGCGWDRLRSLRKPVGGRGREGGGEEGHNGLKRGDERVDRMG